MEERKPEFTIAIFEDNPIVVQGLTSYFEKQAKYPLEVIFSTSEPKEFLEKYMENTPDFAIIDVISEKVIGLEVFENIFEQDPEAIVFAYSNVRSKRIIQSIITMGAAGYISKTEPLEMFDQAFHSLFHHKKVYLPDFLSDISLKEKTLPVILTKTEKKIIPLLIEGKSSKEIANEFFITVNAVDYHKKNLFNKFKVNNIASFVKEVIAQGYSGGINY